MTFVTGLAMALAVASAGGAAQAETQSATISLSLDYEGRLIIKVLDIHLEEQATARDYDAAVSLRDYGLLRALHVFDIKATAHGPIQDGGARPQRFYYDNKDGERDRKVHVDWRPGEVAMSSSPKFGGLGKPPASLAQKLEAADPLTQVVRLTLAPAATCQGEPHFFDGKQLYALSFDAGAPAVLTPQQRALGMTAALACVVRYRELAGFKQRPGQNRDQALKSHISIEFGQFGQGGPWVVASITANTFLGPAVIELRKATVGKDSASPTNRLNGLVSDAN